VIERRRTTAAGPGRSLRAHNTDGVRALVEERVGATDGRISAKRLLPVAVAAGYPGSARNFRRAVAKAKATWRRERRVYRPWVPTPGEHLVMDWGTEGTWQLFCAVLPWSRYRFVRFATNQQRETTLALLAECLALIGGVPKVVLADRMGCLKAGVVADSFCQALRCKRVLLPARSGSTSLAECRISGMGGQGKGRRTALAAGQWFLSSAQEPRQEAWVAGGRASRVRSAAARP